MRTASSQELVDECDQLLVVKGWWTSVLTSNDWLVVGYPRNVVVGREGKHCVCQFPSVPVARRRRHGL